MFPTGKEYPGASLEATYVMAQAIKEYYEKTGRLVSHDARQQVVGKAARSQAEELVGEPFLAEDFLDYGVVLHPRRRHLKK